MQVDRDVGVGGKKPSFTKSLNESTADAIDDQFDGVRVKSTKVIQKRFGDRMSDAWVDLERSATIQLDCIPPVLANSPSKA